MNTYKISQAWLIAFSMFIMIISGCKKNIEEHEHAKSEADEYYYTCTMHLSVKSKIPGACPICGMTLIKVESKPKNHDLQNANIVTMDKHKQDLVGIETDTAKVQIIASNSALLGVVSVDEGRVKVMSSRVRGRINKLFVKSAGEAIRVGSALYTLYSENLLAEEKEYLSLIESLSEKPASKFSETMLFASRNKLLQLGLSEKQILDLEKSKEVNPYITFYSEYPGYVTEVKVSEGMFVESGAELFKIAGLEQVWVEAQVYAEEMKTFRNLKENETFKIYSETLPGELFTGHLVFNNPIITNNKKFRLIKIRLTNTKSSFTPGMMVYVSPQNMTKEVLSVSKTAVLSEKMKTLWVKTGEESFEQRMVKTGVENGNRVEILAGLKSGEIVVTSGSYLINSEFILKNGAGQRHDH